MMPITWNNVADRLKMCYTAKLHPQMRLAAFFHAMSSILIFTVWQPADDDFEFEFVESDYQVEQSWNQT